jgi:anion-transporting  ArsA/GET3 family ATPase
MIHLISGKGGVGKSTVAAALAWRLSNDGRKTLLVELGERSYFRHVFQNDIGWSPVSITTHLSVARWEGEACLREYLHHLLKIEQVVKLFFDNKVMKALVQAAPALRELALLGKITSGPRRVGPAFPYDEIVVDAYSTGHFRALWRAPVGMAEAIPYGPMGEQSRSIVRTLKDPTQTQIYVTMIPEEMPVTEGLELVRDVQAELEQTPRIVLNRWLESPLDREQLKPFAGHDFATYLDQLLERQSSALGLITARGFANLQLPWVFRDEPYEKVRALSARMEFAP